MQISYDLAISFLNIFFETETYDHTKTYAYIHSSFICSSQEVETTQMSFNGRWLHNLCWNIQIVEYRMNYSHIQ